MPDEPVYKAEEMQKLIRKTYWTPYLIIGIGILLLAANLFGFHLMDILWPGFIIAPGLLLLWPAYNSTAEKRNAASFLAVPGAIITTVGLMLFTMNLVDHFEAWAYSWPLIWASVAAAVMYMYRFDEAHTVHDSGRKFIRAMVILCGAMMVLFELVIWGNFNPLLAVGLIAFGVYLLVKNQRQQGA